MNDHPRVFSHDEARRYYDWLGANLDTQSFYEAPPQRDLAAHLDLKSCRAVVEFGCGTGRFAAEILDSQLPVDARYLGIDISSTMVALAKKRLAKYGPRAEAKQSDGSPHIEAADASFERFICSYVLELLADEDMQALLAEAHRVLRPDGLLGIVVLTSGPTSLSRTVSTIWRGLHSLSPWIVGGCRPIELTPRLLPSEWIIEYRRVSAPLGVPSEVVVARRLSNSQATIQ